jgi:hypothetical protein
MGLSSEVVPLKRKVLFSKQILLSIFFHQNGSRDIKGNAYVFGIFQFIYFTGKIQSKKQLRIGYLLLVFQQEPMP